MALDRPRFLNSWKCTEFEDMKRLIICSATLVFAVMTVSCAFAGDGTWTRYLNGNGIFDIEVAGDSVYCATEGGIMVWDKATGESTALTRTDGLLSNQTDGVELDSEGRIWIAFDEDEYRSTIEIMGDSGSISYDPSNSGLTEHKLRGLCVASDGAVWCGSITGGVFEFRDGVWKDHQPDSILNAITLKLFLTSDGTLWLANSRGFWSFDGSEWRDRTSEGGIGSLVVNDIAVTEDGVLWLATLRGAYSYDGANWTRYTKSDGLVSSSVYSVARSAGDVLWFGTSLGVSSYDGETWKSYTGEVELVDDRVTDIAVDGDNNIWLLHDDIAKGISKFNGSEWEWYTIWNRADEKFPSNDVRALTAGPGNSLYIACDTGVYVYDGSQWVQTGSPTDLRSLEITELSVDSTGKLWVLYERSENAGISSYDGNAWEQHNFLDVAITTFLSGDNGILYLGTDDGVSIGDGGDWEHYPANQGLKSSDIKDVAEDSSGVMWFASTAGIARYDGVSWRTCSSGEYSVDSINTVHLAPDGSVWGLSDFGNISKIEGDRLTAFIAEIDTGDGIQILRAEAMGFSGNGDLWADFGDGSKYDSAEDRWYRPLWRYDGSQWKRHEIGNSRPIETIRKIVADGESAIWIASSDGLHWFDGSESRAYVANSPLSNEIRGIAVDNGNNVWFSSDRGLTYIESGSWQHESGIITEDIVFDSDNTLWMNLKQGIFRFADGELTTLSVSDIHPRYSDTITVRADLDGNVITGSNYGFFKHIDGTWTQYTNDNWIDVGAVKEIAVDSKGVYWIAGGPNKGCWRFDGKVWQQYVRIDGLTADTVNAVAIADDDNVWIGTRNGISCYNDTTWTSFNVDDGLAGNNVLTIAVDNNNLVWVGTDSGVSSYDGREWTSYTENDGLTDDYVAAIAVDYNNVKWFATPRGITSYREQSAAGSTPARKTLSVIGNFPNPFNVMTVLEFAVESWGDVDVTIYNNAGQEVRDYHFDMLSAGRKKLVWDGRSNDGGRVSSGVYFFKVHRGGISDHGRMMFIK